MSHPSPVPSARGARAGLSPVTLLLRSCSAATCSWIELASEDELGTTGVVGSAAAGGGGGGIDEAASDDGGHAGTAGPVVGVA